MPSGVQRLGLCEKAEGGAPPVCRDKISASREVEDKIDAVEDRRKSQHGSSRSCFHFVFTDGKEDLRIRKAKCPAKPLRGTDTSSRVRPSSRPQAHGQSHSPHAEVDWARSQVRHREGVYATFA